MLEKVQESKGVLNLSLFESWDKCWVRFEARDDGTLIIGSFPQKERRDIYKRTDT